MRKAIAVNIKRKLYAESMGRCMNPDCETELFLTNGDIAEKAHIVPHCETEDNSFENLILLCPNCHTDFDKNAGFDEDEVKSWKSKRQEQLSKVFAKKLSTFQELENLVKPILENNKTIYENYYLKDNKKLWDKSEETILLNNKKLGILLEKNKDLFQDSDRKEYSNLEVVNQFLLHIDEFTETRNDEEKIRTALFPTEINSIFGVEPITENLLSSLESLQCLIGKLQKENKFVEIVLGVDKPFLVYKEDKNVVLFLDDVPRVRQKYHEYSCFRKQVINLGSLNFAMKYMTNNGIWFDIYDYQNLSNIRVEGKSIKFVYKYCLSKNDIISISPQSNSIIVNLHNWNGDGCISSEAYEQAELMNVKLLTMKAFYKFIYKLKNE